MRYDLSTYAVCRRCNATRKVTDGGVFFNHDATGARCSGSGEFAGCQTVATVADNVSLQVAS